MRKKKTVRELIPKEIKKGLIEQFKELKNDVILEVFTKKGDNDKFNEITKLFTKEIASFSKKITVNINKIGNEKSIKYNVKSSPSILFNPEKYSIRFTGSPIGEEGRSFLITIMLISNGESQLSPSSKEILSKLKEQRHIQVFVTPTCPYCPGQVLNAFKAAIESPDFISAECIESAENRELADKFNVSSVPQTVINESFITKGLEKEDRFIAQLVSLEKVEEWRPVIEEKKIEADLIKKG